MNLQGGIVVAKIINTCPVCSEKLIATELHCAACGLTLKNTFELDEHPQHKETIFDRLNPQQMDFLLTFLRQQGNMKAVQGELGIKYHYQAKKELTEILSILGLSQPESDFEEELSMRNLFSKPKSTLASDIIKGKLIENGGKATVTSVSGKTYDIRAAADGVSFYCSALPIKPMYTFHHFDVVVDLLLRQNGKARKGNGRNYKFGAPECDETTVVGIIAKNFSHPEPGDSVFDPVFIFSAVLEWAGIVHNERGYLQLTASYLEMRR